MVGQPAHREGSGDDEQDLRGLLVLVHGDDGPLARGGALPPAVVVVYGAAGASAGAAPGAARHGQSAHLGGSLSSHLKAKDIASSR